MDRRKNNGPAPNVQSAMDSDEDWENHEVGSLGVLVLGVLVRFLALPYFKRTARSFQIRRFILRPVALCAFFGISTNPGEEFNDG